jgi:uncharacterized protein YciI
MLISKSGMKMKNLLLVIALCLCCTVSFGQERKPDRYASRRFFVLLMSPGENFEHDKPMSQQKLEDHRAYYQKLLEKDFVVIGGGFTEENGGLSILKVRDKTQVDSLVRNDPAVLSGVFKIEVKPIFAVFKGESKEVLDLQGIVFKKQ